MTEPHVRREFASTSTPYEPVRAQAMGRRGAIASGHFLASLAGDRMFDLGGNAIDAGIAASICLNVLLFPRADFGGVMPMILYHAASDRVVTLDGLGVWPAAADIDALRAGKDGTPEGILRAVTPGAPDAWLTALAEFGTLTVGQVVEPAWELAANGAAVSTGIAKNLRFWEEHIREHYPTNYATFYPEGRPYRTGEILRRPELGNVLKSLMDTEAAARAQGRDRREAIREARDVIYKGWVADEIAAFFEREGGWMTKADLAAHAVEVGEPIRTNYRGYEVMSCGPWCQGPVLLQTLNILENFDLASLGHNSPEYLHLLVESIDRAFSDRENYFGDPRAVPVPLQGLLSKEFAAERAATIDPGRASGSMPDPGDPWAHDDSDPGREKRRVDLSHYETVTGLRGSAPQIDTTYCAAMDAAGNIYSATPSDTSMWGPVIPALGFPCSGRGVQSRLDSDHPSAVAPGRRPRLTPNPAMVAVGGRPMMGFGCPGGDIQPQGMLQVFLNLAEFGLNLQQAIEAPRVMSWNFPNSFAPHPYHPGRLDIEGRISDETRSRLREMGHEGADTEDFFSKASSVHAVAMDLDNGVITAGADPRCEGSALAW
ncbi:MAG TPA: gamma-glutamyltransferase family protein [Gaiellaceae bacterium]|jgi:gamma-glutamyltranspeptidase/glutathione hydrolase|nr:gamma-glutamyltransferase family protein [Gaiellaceae bacterium]